MRAVVSLAIFAALGLVAWEVFKKAQAAQNTATAGLQQVSQVAQTAAAARPMPFGLSPILVGGPQGSFNQVVQAVTGLLTPPSSTYKVPALGLPADYSPFSAPTIYTGKVVPSAADLATFGINLPPGTNAGTLNIAGLNGSGNALSIPFDETADLDTYYGN